MSGFGNLGTGLAGFMQGYQNSQQQAAQRALQQQAIEQIQRALAGDRLLANTIFGGGIGNPTPQPSMPGTPSVPTFPQGGGGGAPPIPPAPAAPPSMPPASPARIEDVALDHPIYATPGQPQPFEDDTPIPPPTMQGEMVQDSRPIVRQDLPPPEKPEPASAAPAPAATTAPTPSGSAGSGGGGTEQASAAGGSLANSSLFQQLLDPNHAYKALGEMRDRIAAGAPPGTDPAVIWEATQQLYKLTNGGAMERAQLAAYLKAAGLDLQKEKVGQGQQNIELRRSGQQLTRSGQQAVQNRFERKEERLTAKQLDDKLLRKQKEADARGDRQTVQRLSAVRAKISAIRAKGGIAGPGEEDQAKLDELSKEIDQIVPPGTVAPPSPAPSQ